jgi:hypothetical protein
MDRPGTSILKRMPVFVGIASRASPLGLAASPLRFTPNGPSPVSYVTAGATASHGATVVVPGSSAPASGRR